MRRSTALSHPLQLVFPAHTHQARQSADVYPKQIAFLLKYSDNPTIHLVKLVGTWCHLMNNFGNQPNHPPTVDLFITVVSLLTDHPQIYNKYTSNTLGSSQTFKLFVE
jgi:hypothetical protein